MSNTYSDDNSCAYCGKKLLKESWPHVDGDSNRGVMRIEHFCCEEHKDKFLNATQLDG